MKKVSVITMHRIYNYGSVFQTYAIQKIIEQLGMKCEIVDYISPYRTKRKLFLDYPPRLEGKKLRKIIYYIAKIPSFILKELTFGVFIKENINLSSRKYITNEDLLNNPPIADIYVTGSDQVWNSKYNHGVDKSYYLNYAKEECPKIAYVASFGNTELSLQEELQVKEMLEKYMFISVREDSAVKILKRMNIESKCIIDPTLQITKKEWLEISSRRLEKEKYILLFLLYNEDNGATEYAKMISKKYNIKLVKLSWELKKPNDVDRLFTHRKPEDFISLFSNADFIVTNSFHGVAFSINLNKQFAFMPRSEFNGRIESLLRLTGLENRRIENDDFEKMYSKKIDYNEVNKILDFERKQANSYISEIFRKIQEER